ncbi:MAG: TAXI family TRAP transporter solute-binding subunit [Bacteroidales bacterium]
MKLKNLFSTFIVMIAFSTLTFAQLTILSGPEQASYYRFAQDIVTVVGPELGTPVSSEVTSGAVYNYEQLIDPNSPYKIAFVQADFLYYKQAIDSKDNTEFSKQIKVVLPLAHEEIHIVTKEQNNLNKLQDFNTTPEKKIMAIGTKDQGTYYTANMIKNRSEIYWQSRNIHFDEALNDLYLDQVDAFMIVGSAPIQKLNINPQVMVNPISLVELQDFNGWAKYYDADTIYAKDYKWLEKDIPTFSIKTLLIVNDSKLTDAERMEVSLLKKGILNKIDVLKAEGHPKWKDVDLFDWTDDDWPMFK